MKINQQHAFPVSPKLYSETFFTEEYTAKLAKELDAPRTLTHYKVNGTVVAADDVPKYFQDGYVIERVAQFNVMRDMPKLLQKLVPSVVYNETVTWAAGTDTATWKVEMVGGLNKNVDASGTLHFHALDGGGVLRELSGDVDVHGLWMPGAASVAESCAAKEIKKSYAKAAALTMQWFAEHGQTDMGAAAAIASMQTCAQ